MKELQMLFGLCGTLTLFACDRTAAHYESNRDAKSARANARPRPGAPDSASRGAVSADVVTSIMPATASDAITHGRRPRVAPHAFFSLLGMTSFNEVQLSADQAVGTASLIVRGIIESVVDGRIIDFKNGRSHPMQTAVLKVKVESVIKAAKPPGQFVYVEHIRGGVDPGALHHAKYTDPLIMLLHEADDWDTSVYRFDGQGKGVEDGAVLYTLRTQRGLLAQVGSAVEAPLQPHDPPIVEAGSIVEAEERLRQFN